MGFCFGTIWNSFCPLPWPARTPRGTKAWILEDLPLPSLRLALQQPAQIGLYQMSNPATGKDCSPPEDSLVEDARSHSSPLAPCIVTKRFMQAR
jgi:hypothetical protein